MTPQVGRGRHAAHRKALSIFIVHQGRYHEAADSHHGGHGGAADGSEKTAGQNTGHGQAAGQPSHHHIGESDQFVHNGAAGHHVSAKHKEQHNHQGKLIHGQIKGAGDHHGIGGCKQPDAHEAGEKQAEEHGDRGCHASQQQRDYDEVTQFHPLSAFPYAARFWRLVSM
jgi:hypothetical protein